MTLGNKAAELRGPITVRTTAELRAAIRAAINGGHSADEFTLETVDVERLNANPRLLRLPQVMERTGLGRDSIYALARRGQFPKPRKITQRASAWLEAEVIHWINSRPFDSAALPKANEVAGS